MMRNDHEKSNIFHRHFKGWQKCVKGRLTRFEQQSSQFSNILALKHTFIGKTGKNLLNKKLQSTCQEKKWH